MKILLRRLAVFVIPFIFWLILLVLVDPFNYFNVSYLIPDELKLKTSSKLNSRLWKAVAFKRTPCPNILLGDSRMAEVDVGQIRNVAGQEYFNFAYGGGTLAEIISTFEYARRVTQISNVYIGINFNLYNDYSSANQFTGAELIANDYRYYLFNRSVAEALFYCLTSMVTQSDPDLGLPAMSKEAFWQSQLDYAATYMYVRYKYPSRHYARLKEMAGYCKTHDINLVFVIPPTHVDLQKRVVDFGLADAEVRFKEDLRSLATVYDCDFPNEWTNSREMFSDPYHCIPEVDSLLVSDVWGNLGVCVRVSTPPAAAPVDSLLP